MNSMMADPATFQFIEGFQFAAHVQRGVESNLQKYVINIFALWLLPQKVLGNKSHVCEDAFIVYTSRFVRVILAQGPCYSSPYRSNLNG